MVKTQKLYQGLANFWSTKCVYNSGNKDFHDLVAMIDELGLGD
jgi:hypothetical protein